MFVLELDEWDVDKQNDKQTDLVRFFIAWVKATATILVCSVHVMQSLYTRSKKKWMNKKKEKENERK